MRERSKNSFHFNAINAQKYKNKYFNTIKKIGKKSTIPLFSSKEKRKSVILPKSENKKMVNALSLSKPQINYNKFHSLNYILFCEKFANQMLRDKYNCSKKVRLKILYNKEEIISKYDSYQIEYLIEKRKSSVYCRLKELLFLNKKNEYLVDLYKPRESRIILKYLLFFVYDKDKMTFNEKRTEKINKDKIKSNFEKIVPSLKKRYFSVEFNNDEYNVEIKNNQKQFLNKNNRFIFNYSPLNIYNSVPNLYPNEPIILKVLKEYLSKKLYQKLYSKGLYYYKNISENYDTTKLNKSTKEDKNSRSKTIVNKSFSKYILKKKNNSINNHNENKRIKNDVDIFDIEKLIKGFKGKDKKNLKNSIINKKRYFDRVILSQKIKKKLFFNASGNNNNKNVSKEKNHLSQNSTTLTIRNRESNKSNKLKKGNLVNKGIIYKNNFSKENNNMYSKKLIQNSSEYNSESSVSFRRANKKNNHIQFKNNYLRKILFNNCENNSESLISESFKKKPKNILNESTKFFYPKNLSFKFITLKDFLKFDNETNYSLSKKASKILNPAKSFEFHNDIYIFSQKINENIWERGEDISAQIKAEEIKDSVFKKLKMLNNKNRNSLKKCNTFRKFVNYGDVYFNDSSFY